MGAMGALGSMGALMGSMGALGAMGPLHVSLLRCPAGSGGADAVDPAEQ